MLTLLTGKPGNGKGVYLLDRLLKEKALQNRRIFVWGMELTAQCPYHIEPLAEPAHWYQLPDGAVIVIDECQKVFPPRAATSRPPQHAAAFAEHRHRGHDVILITQDPKDIDAYVRRKVGRHIHLKRSPTNGERATVRTLMNDVMDIDGRGWKGADKFEYVFNKSVYPWYHSADMHTHRRRFPRKLTYAICLLGFVAMGYSYISYAVYQKTQDDGALAGVASEAKHEPAATPSGAPPSPNTQTTTETGKDVLTTEAWLAQFTPRVEGLPWSAPIYDDLTREVREYPIPSCVVSEKYKDKCLCFSQQGTRMDVDIELCRHIAYNGLFNPYQSSNSSMKRSYPAIRRTRL